jgi:AraC-like DNA-binding protein
MPRTTFAVRFKALVGIPPADHLLQRRIQAAIRLLSTSDRTIATIAAECGYSSESAFSKAFKRAVERAPGSFRPAPLQRRSSQE